MSEQKQRMEKFKQAAKLGEFVYHLIIRWVVRFEVSAAGVARLTSLCDHRLLQKKTDFLT